MNKKIKKTFTIILILIVLIAGTASVALYKLGDRIFDEVIDMQINEMEKPVGEAVPAQPSNTQPAAASEIQISKDKLEDIKEAVTPSDKMAAATLVLSKLSQSDISQLKQFTAGGVTAAEIEEMKQMVYERFTAQEIEQIKEMYIKYMK